MEVVEKKKKKEKSREHDFDRSPKIMRKENVWNETFVFYVGT